jgi:hypothetical protein
MKPEQSETRGVLPMKEQLLLVLMSKKRKDLMIVPIHSWKL